MAVLYFYLNIACVRSKGVDIIKAYFSLELLRFKHILPLKENSDNQQNFSEIIEPDRQPLVIG